MSELTPDDVATYTRGRLAADDPITAMLLARALAGARRYCGWIVTPPAEAVDMVLDGPGTRQLFLRTMNLTALTACVEDLVPLDVTGLAWSRQGIVEKRDRRRWSCNLGALRLTVDHGYTEADAEDWRGAVLQACDLAFQNLGQQYQEYTVDDITRKWFKSAAYAFDLTVLDEYRLMGVA